MCVGDIICDCETGHDGDEDSDDDDDDDDGGGGEERRGDRGRTGGVHIGAAQGDEDEEEKKE